MDDLLEWMEFVGTLSGLPHGCSAGWMEFVRTLSWLPHGCSVGMDEVSSGRYHGWDMDALREWMKSHLDVIMVATWMLCGNG